MKNLRDLTLQFYDRRDVNHNHVATGWAYVPLASAVASAASFFTDALMMISGVSEINVAVACGTASTFIMSIVAANAIGDRVIVNIADTEPPRTPRIWPPVPGQCYVCGIHDLEREATLGTANHPTCLEWLGKWNAPLSGGVILSGVSADEAATALQQALQNPRPPVVLPSRTSDTPDHEEWLTGPDPNGIRIRCTCAGHTPQRSLAIPNFEYSWTCKCPVCVNYWDGLRTYSSSHPEMCFCTGCQHLRENRLKLKYGRSQRGPHHCNCVCTNCHLTNPWKDNAH